MRSPQGQKTRALSPNRRQSSLSMTNPDQAARAGHDAYSPAIDHADGNPDEPHYSVRDAAHVCGLSEMTIRRRLEEGMPGAYREGRGTRAPWRIPRSSLVEEQLLPDEARKRPGAISVPDDRDRVIEAQAETIDALRELVASQEHRIVLLSQILAQHEQQPAASVSPITTQRSLSG